MAIASENEFPQIILKERSNPVAPASGEQKLFVDQTDHLLKMTNAAGATHSVDTPNWVTISPDTPPVVANAMDDEFDGNSLDAKWTTFYASTPTISVANGLLVIRENASNERLKGVLQNISGSAWKFRTHVYLNGPVSNYNGLGFLLKNSVNGYFEYFGLIYHSSYGYLAPMAGWFSNQSTAVGNSVAANWFLGMSAFLELEYDGTDFILRTSADGFNYEEAIRHAKASWLAGNPTQIGLSTNQYGVRINTSFSWFRRLA